MSEIIRVENLSYIYNQGMPDATKALDDVSFTVEEGDFVGIIGSTGSGKSTLISHFNGLNRPTSGRVLVDGRDLWEQGADLRSFRFLVGLVMQYPEYQLFEETCARDIAYGPRNMGLDEAEVQRRVREAAAFVGLSDELLEKSPFELSGGQKRRVAIAGVMAMHPRVLVLDEPAAGLNPEGRDTILSQIRDYHEKTGITVLLVSHSMEDIAKYANWPCWSCTAPKLPCMTRWKTSLPAHRSCWSWGRCRRSRRSFKAASDGAGHPRGRSHDPLCGQNDSKGAGHQTGRWGKCLKILR